MTAVLPRNKLLSAEQDLNNKQAYLKCLQEEYRESFSVPTLDSAFNMCERKKAVTTLLKDYDNDADPNLRIFFEALPYNHPL